MFISYQWRLAVALAIFFIFTAVGAQAQSINGTVVDPTGAVIPTATVEIHNPVSHYDQSTTTDSSGHFSFTNVPFNPYHLSVNAPGFTPYARDVEIRSNVPLEVPIKLQVTGSSTTVDVEATASDLLENDSTAHTDVDKSVADRIPLESQSSSLSSLITLASPGISADSNGLFTDSGIMPRTPFRSMVNRSRIRSARFFRIRFLWIPFSRWKSLLGRRRRSTEERPALLSWPRPAPGKE